MAEKHRLASLAQLAVTPQLAVRIDEQEIALFLVEGEVLATAGRCPHARGFLHKGSVCDGKVSCPWHGWSWNLRTGECDESDELSLPRYAVELHGDDVYVVI